MFWGFQPNPPEINTKWFISGGFGWNPNNIENTKSFICFFNPKHKTHGKHTVFHMIFQSETWKDWKHTIFYIFYNRKYKNGWNTHNNFHVFLLSNQNTLNISCNLDVYRPPFCGLPSSSNTCSLVNSYSKLMNIKFEEQNDVFMCSSGWRSLK